MILLIRGRNVNVKSRVSAKYYASVFALALDRNDYRGWKRAAANEMEEPVPCGRDVENRRRPDGRTRLGRESKERRGTRRRMSERKKERRECNGSEKQSETYELILIGGDSGEYGLREYEGLVRLLLEVHDRLGRTRVRPLHQVDPRLVLVHRVQHQLQIIRNCITLPVEMWLMAEYVRYAFNFPNADTSSSVLASRFVYLSNNYCKKWFLL